MNSALEVNILKGLCPIIFVLILATCGCSSEIKKDTINITALQNQQENITADNSRGRIEKTPQEQQRERVKDISSNQKVPLLIIKDYIVEGHYLQKCWYWRGFWDIETNSISMEETPLIEPLEAMAGGYNHYHFAWDGSNQFILTHSISNKNLGVLNFASRSKDFSIDTYMVNTLPERDYAVSFRSKNQQSTYTTYVGELGLTILCRSETGNHWNLSFMDKDITPLLIAEQGVEEPGILLVYRDKNGRQNLSWLNVKGNERRWFSIETDIPSYLSSSQGELLVGTCIIGDKIYLSGFSGKIYSFVIENNKEDTNFIRSIQEKEISNIITSEWDKNPPSYLKYTKLGAYQDILLVYIYGADGNDRIFAFKDSKLLAKLVLNNDVVEHYLSVILPQQNYGSLFNN